MPALVVDTAQRPPSSPAARSPSRPPVSPITPRASVAHLAPVAPAPAAAAEAQPRLPPPRPPAATFTHQQPPAATFTHQQPPAATFTHHQPPAATFTHQPPALALAETDNPDALALRSAISILQLQREKTKRDLHALAALKPAAVADPAAFVQSIQQRRAQAAHSYNDVLTPTLAGLAEPDSPHTKHAQARADARKDSAHVGMGAPRAPAFPAIPQPQNIVRCPPINWEKYHIVGEPLDKLHEEQKKWPGHSDPPRTQSGHRAPSHSIAAPYSPFEDGIARPSSTSHSQPAKASKNRHANDSPR